MAHREPVYLEVSARRTFACALNWPGWARSGKGAEAALQALAAFAPRYAAVARAAGLPFEGGEPSFEVIEELPGSSGTGFGAPMAISAADHLPVDAAGAGRLASLVAAAWQVFDEAVALAPQELRKGPRGGGRDRDRIAAHVVEAERDYARKLGLRLSQAPYTDAAALAASRTAILAAITSESTYRRIDGSKNPWPLPYAARRIAWHVLDHAWEIEDRQ